MPWLARSNNLGALDTAAQGEVSDVQEDRLGDGWLGAADRALRFAKSMASEEEATLTVVHVVQRFAGGKAAGLPRHVDAAEIEAKVRKEVNELSSEGLNVSLQVISDIKLSAAEDRGLAPPLALRTP